MTNGSEKQGGREAMANDTSGEAREKRVHKQAPDIKRVPSVAETVETWSWLSTSLRDGLRQDLDLDLDLDQADDEREGPALRDADIE